MTTESKNRPYAPAASVIDTLQRLRKRNLPESIDTSYLIAAGMSKEVAGRVLTTFRFLGLMDDAGTPTDALRSLARSTDEDYKTLLEGIVMAAYSEVFTVVHPGDTNQDQIVNAFRRYEPGSQHYRMAVLFLALCKEAGIPVQDEPRKRETQSQKHPVPKKGAFAPTVGGAPRSQRASRRGFVPSANIGPAQGSAVLSAYFSRLPAPGSVFTDADRQVWLDGMKMAFNLEYKADSDAS